MKLFRIAPLAILLCCVTQPNAYAGFGSSCFEPSRPYCLDSLSYSRDEYTFNSCRNEVERYSRAVKSFIECRFDEVEAEYKKQLSEAQMESTTKRSELNRVIQRFNCYAKGGSFCP